MDVWNHCISEQSLGRSKKEESVRSHLDPVTHQAKFVPQETKIPKLPGSQTLTLPEHRVACMQREQTEYYKIHTLNLTQKFHETCLQSCH